MLSETKFRKAGKTLLQTLFFFLLITQICFAQWVQFGLENKSIKDIVARNSAIFAITSDIGSVYRSTNNGINWLQIIDSTANDIAVSPSGSLFMVKADPLLYKQLHISTDNGNTWEKLNVLEQLPPPPPLIYPFIENISISNSGNIFCGLGLSQPPIGRKTAFAFSLDEGNSWTTPGWDILGGLLFDFRDQYVITVGELLYNFGVAHRVYFSSDYGNTWVWEGHSPGFYSTILNLCLNKNILWSGENVGEEPGGIFISIDSCFSWTRVSYLIPQTSLSIESGGMLAGTDSLGVFLFSDNGDSLGPHNEGLTDLNIHSITIDEGDFIYIGTDNGVWRRPLSEITFVEEEEIDEMPTEFLLSQNYPNPFNPSTSIKYAVSSRQFVSLKVYDVLGNEIETLVNEEKQAGTYEVTWYEENLPSGVYFYQLRSGNFLETKKMLLLK